LASTPPEINIKIDAWNAARRRDALRDYNLVTLFAIAVNNPSKLPEFNRFYPEKDSVDSLTASAMKIAKRLGDI
jgi:hypothetical protein